MRNGLRPLAAIALVTLFAAGCSNASAGPTKTSGREAAVTFSTCMRENGVTQFPDPDASGELTADGVANNSSVDTNGPAWTKAIAACKDLEPAGFTGTKRSAAEQAASVEFARCIRENGVPDFPDPDPNGPIVDTNRIPSSNTKAGMAAINAGMKTCGEVWSGRMGITK